VRFAFKPGQNRELPLILGQLPVLPKHAWEGRDFEATALEAPLGSGPYRIGRFEPGRYVVFERVPDWWGRDLPVNRGRHNFDALRFDYYRDETVELEAFKSGAYDFRREMTARYWATAYEEMPELASGLLVKERAPHQQSEGMQGFVLNQRREIFRDRRVREALGYAYDFEWTNKNLQYGEYQRTRSYFENSELAARGLPGPAELALLEPLRGRVPEEVFTREYQPPSTDGSGQIRENLRRGAELLDAAGWRVRDGRRVRESDGLPLAFEILLDQPGFERIVLPFKKNLERLGVPVTVRLVDDSQYRRRVDAFDFDVIIVRQGQSLSPGNEQREYWGSEAAARPGSRNVYGIADPVVDELIELVVSAPDRESLVARTRALDRVLLWGHYVIPQYHMGSDRLVYWDKLGKPPVVPMQGFQLDAWWLDAEKAARLEQRRKLPAGR
jgi:microcin C transport system substrate-binding protein